MARRARQFTDHYARLIYFASLLSLKTQIPELSYLEAEVLEDEDDPITVLIPVYWGAIKVLEEIDRKAWLKCCQDTELPEDLESIIEPFCAYLGISQSVFTHFFVPAGQITAYASITLNRTSTFQDIASLIFDYVLIQKATENGFDNLEDYLKTN